MNGCVLMLFEDIHGSFCDMGTRGIYQGELHSQSKGGIGGIS